MTKENSTLRADISLESLPGYPVYQEYLSLQFGSVDAEYYMRDFDLRNELRDVREGAQIVDVGCGVDAVGVSELQRMWPQYTFIGVNPTFEEATLQNPPIRLIKSPVEELSKYLSTLPTSLVLARNVFHNFAMLKHARKGVIFNVLTTVALKSIYDVLEPGGRLLIYDYAPRMKNPYQLASKAAKEVGFSLEVGNSIIDINQPPERQMEYLRLIK